MTRSAIGAGFFVLVASIATTAGNPPLPGSDEAITRIAFGSCAFQSVEQPVFREVVASQPDLYLSLGDAIYGDYDLATKSVYEVTPESLRREWQVLADNPDWQYLRSRVPIMATWDNHDYGHHSAGAEFPLREESERIFLDFLGEPEDSSRRERTGIYYARVFGPEGRRVQLILLDTRSFKSPPLLAERDKGVSGSLGKYAPNRDPAATLLGAEQWAWLESQLREPAELRLIASSGQIIPDEKGMDEWGNYPLERQRLLQLAASNETRVLLLSGNVHFTEASQSSIGGVPLVEFTASGLTHVNEVYPRAPNSYRVAGPLVEPNFGLVDIEWKESGVPLITLSAVRTDGTVAFTYEINGATSP
jgi:alkaline phosphatase D